MHLGKTYNNYLRLIGKCVFAILLVLIVLFFRYALRANIGSKSAILRFGTRTPLRINLGHVLHFLISVKWGRETKYLSHKVVLLSELLLSFTFSLSCSVSKPELVQCHWCRKSLFDTCKIRRGVHTMCE